MPGTRLSGHGLRSEGKPCEKRGGYGYDIVHRTSEGRALCECGQRSPVLESDGARKRWHREHKEQLRGGYEAANGNRVSEEEKRAIDALQSLAKRWPQSLQLLSMDGGLCVIHANDPRFDFNNGLSGAERQECILAEIDGIPNDGGGW